jgi:hypothetical protein
MKVLGSTPHTQGIYDNDFKYVPDGELVWPPREVCDGGSVDDACGCRRAWCGSLSHKGTTTAIVLDVRTSIEQLVRMYLEWRRTGGFTDDLESARGRVLAYVEQLEPFSAGSILGYRGGVIELRDVAQRAH